jgi:hypothetical protein
MKHGDGIWRFGLAVAVLSLAAVSAACREVGRGDLRVQNDLSGIGRDNTIFRAYAPEPGDAWPPAGQLSLYVRGDDFGSPPSYGMNGFVYLVRTGNPCPQSEGRPETFTLGDVTIAGVVTVTNGTVNQFLIMPDTPANRQSTWALIDIGALQDFPGEHFIRRCGTVTWTP